MAELTQVAIISRGEFIGITTTDLPHGEPVIYGLLIAKSEGLAEVAHGLGEISRDPEYLTDENMRLAKRYDVW